LQKFKACRLTGVITHNLL